jgi:hypothetical protein
MLAQGILQNHERLAAATPIGLGLPEHEAVPTAIDRVLPPEGVRKQARDVCLVGTVEDSARDIGHAFVGQGDEAGQIVLEMPKLAPLLKQVAEDPCVIGNHRHRCHNR